MNPIELQAALVAATFVIMEVIKRTKLIKDTDRWIPIASVALGTALGIAYQVDPLQAILIGAAASGIYNTGKAATPIAERQ